jgi:hypothetical protein
VKLFKMALLRYFLASTFLVVVSALTVEETWNSYKANPKKAAVEDIPDFETFKRQWDEAKAFNAKYATTEDAWIGYKV